MSAPSPMPCHSRQAGFSLIELVVVIVILAIGATAVGGQFMQSARSWTLDETVQTANQLAQERAEDILANRRANGFAAVPVGTTNDSLTGSYSGYNRTVVTSAYAGAACPVANCRQVVITVTDGGGNVRAETRLMLASY